ncbi:hypothetical protein [Bacillus bombysepticus]|uniref:hypothetical protein n=1 Tax=Bacillus bombysepticus TaxID=658666 RepID=UPI003019B96A
MEQVKSVVTKAEGNTEEGIKKQMKINQEKIVLLQEQISAMDKDKRKLVSQNAELKEELERRRYNGMTQHEYFKSIWQKEIKDGDYTIKIGGVWESELSARITLNKKEYTLKGRFSSEGGLLRIAKLDNNGGVKGSKETLYTDLSDSERQIYEDLSVVKGKYGRLMEEGKIKPLSSEN